MSDDAHPPTHSHAHAHPQPTEQSAARPAEADRPGGGRADPRAAAVRELPAFDLTRRADPAAAPEDRLRLIADIADRDQESMRRLRRAVESEETLLVARRDAREAVLSGNLIDGLSGLKPAQRLGPFKVPGGIDTWFEVFLAARRTEIREAGNPIPALVLTQARPPEVGRGGATFDIEAGTVWIRGDLMDAGLPAGAFVGINVRGGELRVPGKVTVVDDVVVEVSAPLEATLQVHPAQDEVKPVKGACTGADASANPPETLIFGFAGGSSTVEGSVGDATVWGQRFEFPRATGGRQYIPRLWTLMLEYEFSPNRLDSDPAGDDLVTFAGVADVSTAGLGLPVVVGVSPAGLGAAAIGAHWVLLLKGLSANWYRPDPRPHELAAAWLAVSAFGVMLVADSVAPLSPPVQHDYAMWTIAGGGEHRVPWRQRYKDPFALLYRCHVIEGEHLMVEGRAALDLDRPVTTNGQPLRTATGQGIVLLHRFGDVTSIMLGANLDPGRGVHQFALRNALIWTTPPMLVYVTGTLSTVDPELDAVINGQAQLAIGVHYWVPILPDPYVSNGFIQAPRNLPPPRSGLLCRISWTKPAAVRVSFDGQLGGNVALGGRPASSGDPRPMRTSDNQPDVGLTQVAQGTIALSREEESERKQAQGDEQESRGQRWEAAQQENKRSVQIIDSYMREFVGPTPGLLLLDVSTNQDLLGVAVGGRGGSDSTGSAGTDGFAVEELAVHAEVGNMRVVTLPQVQWEPVRTLDADQDIATMGWFPTPLASATDGGATHIGARSQKLMPVIPEDALHGTIEAYRDGIPVGVRTTFPFGLIAAVVLEPKDAGPRKADRYGLTRPKFPEVDSHGGIQVTARAEGGRPDDGGISPTFRGQTRQLLNGVDLASGTPLGLSVLGETLQPAGSVETIFNLDMAANPRVPVTRIDLSGYGGSNFSDWNNPFAAFADTAKVQFRVMVGRTALEVIKINSVLHPWGVRVTRSVTIERRPGGGVIRRDSGWQAFTPGLFDYRYFDKVVNDIVVAPYTFDAGVFRGLFNARTIRPAPGQVFSQAGATLVPYYFDADVALEGVPGRTAATGILGYLQTTPNGLPASVDAIKALIEAQGPIGGPIDTWMDFGGSGLPFRAQRVEVGLAMDGADPVFVATVRGVPKLPETGSWSVVTRPVANVPAGGGEAVTVAENRGVPVIRRYPVRYIDGDDSVYTEPPLSGAPGEYRFADAADLLTPASPANEYALLQSAPTHAFLFPRPSVPNPGVRRLESGNPPALVDVLARSTSKGAFPPRANTIELAPGSLHFDVGTGGKLALSGPISVVGHPTPLRLAGTPGHGSSLFYDTATLRLELGEDRWEAEFTGLRVWSDIVGMERLTGSEMRIVGSTEQRSQIAEIKSLMLQEIEDILRYIPLMGSRGSQGPVELGASNAKHELKIDVRVGATIPPTQAVFPAGAGVKLKLFVTQSTGVDLATGGAKASATFGAELEGKVPLLSIGVAAVFLVVSGKISFTIASINGTVTSEKLDFLAFVGIGVEGKIGPFKAYAFLGVGFVLTYDIVANQTKYGGLVALEAGIDLVIVKVNVRAELKGLVYDQGGKTMCDYGGSVKVQVDIFFIFSISATYQVTETTQIGS